MRFACLFATLSLVALSACATPVEPNTVESGAESPADVADPALLALENELGRVPLDELQRRIAAGDTKALAELGSRYGTGNGVPRDYAKALELLQAAAEKGEADAEFYIGTAFSSGAGVPADESIAVLWYERAAQKGHAAASYWLAVRVANGIGGISPNWEAAVPLLWTSATKGYMPAEFLLGYAYQTGSGVEKNPAAAAYWYRRTNSRLPNTRAQYNLRLMIERGEVQAQPGDPGVPVGESTAP